MEKAYSCRIIAMFTVLALCKYSWAEWNVTREPANKSVSCGPHSNRSDCTEIAGTAKWSGHFTKCPKEYRHYCIHGKCRFIREQNTPSCICPQGYIGSRCEYIDFDLRVGDQRQIIIACVIAALFFLVFLILFICMCAHRKKLCRRKKRKEEKTEEKLNMMSSTRETSENASAAAETSETNAV